MPAVLYLHARGGTALEYALPRVAAHAEVHLLAVAPPPEVSRAEWEPHLASLTRFEEAPVGAALTEQVVSSARKVGADAVFTLSEFALLPVAAACDRLGMRGPGPKAVLARDKRRMREVWEAAGVPVPRHRRVGSLDDLLAATEQLTTPLLLKVAGSGGSIGQVLVRDRADAPRAWEEAQAAVAPAAARGMIDLSDDRLGHAFLAEELIDSSVESWYDDPRYGDYLSVEGLVVDGTYRPVCVTGRIPTIEPFTELSNQAPCVLDEEAQRVVEAAARQAVDALGLGTCGTHTELKLQRDRRVCLLETAARLAGALVPREVEVAYGVDLVGELTKALLGQPVRLPDRMLTRGTGRAAATVALIATDARGSPWRHLPTLRTAEVDWSRLVSPGSTVEVVASMSSPDGEPMPRYDAAAGVLNFAGLAFLEAGDPATLVRDTHAILDGLEAVMSDLDLEVREERPPAAEVIELFRAAELNGPLDDEARTQRMLDEAQQVLTVRLDGRLVGLVRTLTDFAFNAFIADLAVHPDHQRRGIGSALVRATVEAYPEVKFVVQPGHDSGPFWERMGFAPAPGCVVRMRSR
jgi:biotin carboxylase/GNAT superfamily N-acetyltransferase